MRKSIFTVAAMLLAKGMEANSARDLTVFGDSIEPYDFKAQPGVGLLSTENNNCTATLVDRELFLTAAHCVTEPVLDAKGVVIAYATSSQFLDSMNLNVGYTHGTLGKYDSKVKKIYVPKEYANAAANSQLYDFAIGHLDTALGDAVGNMVLTNKPASSYGLLEGNTMVSFMYPDSNATGAVVHCCPILGEVQVGHDKGMLAHKCSDSNYGSDGAPIFVAKPSLTDAGQEQFSIEAMNVKPGKKHNYALATKPINELLQFAKREIIADAPYNGTKLKFAAENPVICKSTATPTRKHVHAPTKHKDKPTLQPTTQPSTSISDAPTSNSPSTPSVATPSVGKTSQPTDARTSAPSTPSLAKTSKPTILNTYKPTTKETAAPMAPTVAVGKTSQPTDARTSAPSTPSLAKTSKPTILNTYKPTTKETAAPKAPTVAVDNTWQPTDARTSTSTPSTPSLAKTSKPTILNTYKPTTKKTAAPTAPTPCPPTAAPQADGTEYTAHRRVLKM